MNRKKFIKNFTVLALFVALALVYTFAQKSRSHQKSVPANEEKEAIVATEETGTPTNDDPWKEMDKLVQAYYGVNGVVYKGTLKLIDDNGDQEKVLEESPFEYSFFNGNFQYFLDSMEIINQDKYIVAIDHRSRLISLSGMAKRQTGSQLFDPEIFKKLMLEQKANAAITQSGNDRMLTIENIQHPQIQGYRIYYDPQTYKINKMLIGMLRLSPLVDAEENDAESNGALASGDAVAGEAVEDNSDGEETEIDTYTYYIEINYTESRDLSSGAKGFDPIHKVLKISKDKIELQPAFAAYELLHTTAQTE